MQSFQYFSSVIHRAEEPDGLRTLQIEEKDWNSSIEGSRYVQTENLAHNPVFFNFKKNLETLAIAVSENDGYDVARYEFKANSIWGQKVAPPAHHYLHVHGNSIFSGFYILKVKGNCPYPVFSDPRPGKLMGDLAAPLHSDVKPSTQYIHFNNLEPGTLLFFNSWLPHQFIGGENESEVQFLHFVITAIEK